MMSRLGRINLSPFMRELAQTALASLVTILCLLLSTKFFASGLGAEGFGAYSLARRVVSAMEPISTLVMLTALTRYVAFSSTDRQRHLYLIAGLLLVWLANFIIMLFVGMGNATVASFLFGKDGEYGELLTAITILLFAYSHFILLYSLYRATGKMSLANAWQVVVVGLVPLAISTLSGLFASVEVVILMCAFAFSAAVIPLFRFAMSQKLPTFTELLSGSRDLVRYALPRIPGAFAYSGIFAVAPVVSTQFGSIRGAGFIVIGQMVLRIFEGGFEAIGRAAFPRFSSEFAAGGKPAIRRHVVGLMAMILHVGLFLMLQFLVWGDVIVVTWLGSGYQGAVGPVFVTVLGLIPYLYYVMLRTVMDVIEVRAVINSALYWAIVTTVAITWITATQGKMGWELSVGTSAGFAVLGIMIARRTMLEFAIQLRELCVSSAVQINLILLIPALFARFLVGFDAPIPYGWVVAAIVELMISLCFVLMLRRANVHWWLSIERRLAVKKSAVTAKGTGRE